MTRKRNKQSSTDRQRLYVYLTENQKNKLTEYTGSLGMSNSKFVTKLITKAIKEQMSFDYFSEFEDDPDFIGNNPFLNGKIKITEENILKVEGAESLEVYKHNLELFKNKKK